MSEAVASKKDAVRVSVHRPPASATWEHTHRWGTSFGDSTDLRVTRTSGGFLRIAYGKDSIEIRGELVAIFAQMVTEAAAWSGPAPPPPPAATPGATT